MRARFISALALSVAFNLQLAAGQATASASDQNPVIRSRAGEVLLDMVVRDKHHRLVNDLALGDVEIYEDGVLQEIKHFQLAQGAEELQSERKDVAKTAEKGSQSVSPAHQETLKQLNFVSIVFAPTAPLNREFAREAVLDFLKSDTLPNTYVTIYSMGNTLQLVQPYTADKDTLMAAVNKVSKGISSKTGSDASTAVASSAIATTLGNAPVPSESAGSTTDPMLGEFSGAIGKSPLWARNAGAQDTSVTLGAALEAQGLLAMATRFDSSQAMATMDALRRLIQSQQRLPGRKVVLYLSDGLSFPADRREVVDNLISLANRTGVTFYTVDTRGLSSEDETISGLASMEMTGAESRQRGAVTSPVAGHKEMGDVAVTAVSNRQLSMQDLAESTGGFAVTNTNQIAEPMQRVMEDIRTHYELSYAPKSTSL